MTSTTTVTQPTENKMQLCRFFQKGTCKNGIACTFSHAAQLCAFFKNGTCRFGAACKYVHDNTNVTTITNVTNVTNTNKETHDTVCKHFQTGECKFGNKCKYLHMMQQQKPNDTLLVPKMKPTGPQLFTAGLPLQTSLKDEQK